MIAPPLRPASRESLYNPRMAARDDILRTLSAAMPELARDYHVTSVWVFGSIARGEDGPTSDADVLVEFSRTPTLFTLARLQRRLEELVGRPVDVGTPDSLREAIRTSVMREALRVA